MEAGEIVAERFDFTMMETFYAHLLKIDEYGERLTSKSPNLGRIMTKEGLTLDEEETPEEEPEEGAETAEKPVIALQDMTKVFYFQWRVDTLEQGNYLPKIYIGIARQGLTLKTNLSTSKEVYCIYLATGDVLGKRRWKDYYTIEPNK